jgi:hypothetical protein
MDKDRILPPSQKVLNMKLKGKCSTGRPGSRWEQQIGKDVIQKEAGN